MRYTRVTAADRSHCLPRKQRADPAADAIVLEAGADSSVHHDVRVDSVVGIHAHRILPLEVAKVGRNRNILLSGSHPPSSLLQSRCPRTTSACQLGGYSPGSEC